MKKIQTAIAGMAWITGLVLAGSEVQSFETQLIVSTAGTMLFAVSSMALIRILRG